MPTRYRRSTVSTLRRSGPRRKSVWATHFVASSSVASGAKLTATNLLADIQTAGSSTLGATIARVHLSFFVNFVDTDTSPGVFMGLLVHDSQGASAIDPSTNFFDDWMWHKLVTPGTAITAAPQPINAPTSVTCGWEFDIRAKRRLHQMGDNFYLVAQNSGLQAAVIGGFARTLLLLP